MQLSLTRDETLSQMRALMGQQQSEGVSGISSNPYKAFIDAAYLKALSDCTWVTTEVRVTVDLGAEQYLLPFPTDCGPGSVVEVVIADPADGQYRQLSCVSLPV